MALSVLNIKSTNPKNGLVYKKGYSAFIKHLLVFVDLLLINLAIWLSYYIRFSSNPFIIPQSHFESLVIVSILTWVFVIYIFNIYAISRVQSWESIIWNIIKAILVHCLIFSLFILSVKGYYYSRYFIVLYYTLAGIFILIWRSIFVYSLKKYRLSGHNFRNIVVVGSNKASEKVNKFFKTDKSNGYRVKAFFTDNSDDSFNEVAPYMEEDRIYEYLGSNHIDEVYCTHPLTAVKKIRTLMSYCENNLIRFRYIPDFRALLYKNFNMEFYGNIPVLSVRDEPLENIENRILKRVFDICFSFFVLLFLLVLLFPIIAFAIKSTSNGPVFFTQLRSGKNNRFFLCYKFRTMTMNDSSDSKQAIKQDPRITKVGEFLRKTSLDELPQFMNVLIGNMSVVGPRPHMIAHTDEYKKTIDKFMIRHFAKPGITGWAQVNGFRGLTETPKKMIKRVRYDVWYIENWSFLLDIKIIFMTLFNLAKGEKNAF